MVFCPNTKKVSRQHIIKQLPVKFHSINPCRNWGLKPEILLKKRQVFSYESSEILKNTFFIEHLRWLLLSLIIKLQYGGIGSFWDFCIFGLIFFLYINDFLMVWNKSVFRILSSIAIENVKNRREKNQKSVISGQFFSFLNFWNLEIDFGINLHICYW